MVSYGGPMDDEKGPDAARQATPPKRRKLSSPKALALAWLALGLGWLAIWLFPVGDGDPFQLVMSVVSLALAMGWFVLWRRARRHSAVGGSDPDEAAHNP